MEEHSVPKPTVTIKIDSPSANAPKEILANGEIFFAKDGGLLSGLKLSGFSVNTDDDGGTVVKFPSKPGKNGRPAFVLLRPADPKDSDAGVPLRRAIRHAYGEFVEAKQQDDGAADVPAESDNTAL